MKAGVRDARATEQIVAHDHEGEPRRANVLLRAAVDHAELRYVDRPRQNRRGHVRDERRLADLGHEVKLDAADRLVRRVVQVRGIWRQPPVRDRRNRGIRLAGVGGYVDLRVVLRFTDRLLRPGAGVHVVDDAIGRREVQRHACELRGCAPLQEQHLVVLRHSEQFAQIGLGGFRDRDERLAAMAHLHHRHTRAAPIEQFLARLFEHFQRQDRRAGTEVENAFHGRSDS